MGCSLASITLSITVLSQTDTKTTLATLIEEYELCQDYVPMFGSRSSSRATFRVHGYAGSSGEETRLGGALDLFSRSQPYRWSLSTTTTSQTGPELI